MSLLTEVKASVRRHLPQPVLDAARYVLLPEARTRSRLAKELIDKRGPVVKCGPFQGMRYVDRAAGSQLLPKLTGTYEKELWVALDELTDRYDGLVDIGAAEGYYAVGFLRNMATLKCHAFEADASARVLSQRVAQLNAATDRLMNYGLCTVESLQSSLSVFKMPFLLSDCEGAEFHLLNPVRVPALLIATVIVEVHGHVEHPPGQFPDHPTALADCLKKRFENTHHIREIPIEPRILADWPAALADVGAGDQRLAAMNEHRWPGPGWLFLTPKSLFQN